MKTRNIDIEHNPLLINHICKHIILEAPTIAELQKKIKEYELILAKALTNVFRLSHLSLETDGSFRVSPNGSYQTSIVMTFSGKKKLEVSNPEKTLYYVKQLAALESKKQHESNIIKSFRKLEEKSIHSEAFTIEGKDESELEQKISQKQRTMIENLIERTILTQISFLPTEKNKDSKTGKISITITANYTSREQSIAKAEIPDK